MQEKDYSRTWEARRVKRQSKGRSKLLSLEELARGAGPHGVHSEPEGQKAHSRGLVAALLRRQSRENAGNAGVPGGSGADLPPAPHGAGGRARRGGQAGRGGRRVLRLVLALIFLPLLAIVAGLAWLTSPLGEEQLTRLVTKGVNYAGQPVGLRVELRKMSGLWDGELRVADLKIFDPEGPWLSVEEGVLHPRWGTLARGAAAVLQKRRGEEISPALRVDVPATPTPTPFNPSDYERRTSERNGAGGEAASGVTAAPVISPAVAPPHGTTAALPGGATAATTAMEPINNTAEATAGRAAGDTVMGAVMASVAPGVVDAGNETVDVTAANRSEVVRAIIDPLLSPEDVTQGKVTVGIALGTLLGVELPRMPKYRSTTPPNGANAPSMLAGPLRLMPSWLAVDVGELEIAYLHLGVPGRDMYITARLHGQIAESKARIRASVLGEMSNAPQKILPPIQDLPGDVTLSLRELRGGMLPRQAAPVAVPGSAGKSKEINALLSLDWNEGEGDLRWQLRDTLVLTHFFPGIERMWSRARVQVLLPQWPPTLQKPLRLRTASRFGLSVTGVQERVRASLFSGQGYWDGRRFVVRDLNLSIPQRNPDVTLQGSAGMDLKAGPGMHVRLHINDLSLLGRALDLEQWKRKLGGAVDVSVDVGRGGRYALWWTRTLSNFDMRPLPGFVAEQGDKALLASRIRALPVALSLVTADLKPGPTVNQKQQPTRRTTATAKNTAKSVGTNAAKSTTKNTKASAAATAPSSALPRASEDPTALQIRLKVDSKEMLLPAGKVENLALLLRGASLDASTAPAGTATRRGQGATGAPSVSSAKESTPSQADKAQSAKGKTGQGGGAAAGDNSQSSYKESQQQQAGVLQQFAAEAKAVEDTAGVTAELTENLVAVTFEGLDAEAGGHVAAQADADFTSLGLPRGLVGMLSLQADNFFGLGTGHMRSDWLLGGMHGDADVFMARFDKLDADLPGMRAAGNIDFAYALPLRRRWPWVDGQFHLALDNWRTISRFVESPVVGGGLELQLRMESLFDSKGDARQYLKADVEAQRLDAPSFMVRTVRGSAESQHVHALADVVSLSFVSPLQQPVFTEPPVAKDFRLLNARLQLGSGAGGPISWESGNAEVVVSGEAANFEATLRGIIQGLLHGSYNFRDRLLQLRRMEFLQQNGMKKGKNAAAGPLGFRLQKPAEISLLGGVDMRHFSLALVPSGRINLQGGFVAARESRPALASASTAEQPAAQAEDPLPTAVAGTKSAPQSVPQLPHKVGAEPDPELSRQGSWNARASVEGLPLALPRAVLALVGAELPLPDGEAGLQLRLDGPLNKPRGQADLTVKGMVWPDAPHMPPLALNFGARLDDAKQGSTLRLAAALDGPADASPVRLNASLPLRFDPLPALAKDADGAAKVQWQGEAASLWRYVPLPGRQLKGKASLVAEAGGRDGNWHWKGRAELSQGQFVDSLQGISLKDITLSAAHSSGESSQLTGSASDGRGGGLTLRGLLHQAAAGPQVDASVELRKLRPLRRDDLALQLSGKLDLTGPLLSPLLSGGIVLDNGSFTLLRNFSATVRDLELVEEASCDGPLPPPALPPLAASSVSRPPSSPPVSAALGAAPLAVSPAASPPASAATSPAQPAASLSVSPAASAATSLTASPSRAAATSLLSSTPSSSSVQQTVTQAVTGTSDKAVTTTASKPVHIQGGKNATASVTPVTPATANQTVKKAVAKQEAVSNKDAAKEAEQGGATGLRLDLSIDAPGHFFIRGKGLDSEWRAKLKVLGSLLAPRLLGELAPVRGNFDFLGRTFRFEGGQIGFNGQNPPNPALDLTLGFSNPHITALVRVSGSAGRPRLDLTSQPVLPRDEVMAQVLFGKSMGSLSRFETLQAANAARQLVDLGPKALDVLGTTRQLLGLEVLRFGSGSAKKQLQAPRDASMRGQAKSQEGDADTTLEAGKYLTDNIYVGVEQSARPQAGTAVRVEVELSPHVSVTGRTSPESSGVGLSWKLDY